jgi:hypothetical protein
VRTDIVVSFANEKSLFLPLFTEMNRGLSMELIISILRYLKNFFRKFATTKAAFPYTQGARLHRKEPLAHLRQSAALSGGLN